MKLKVVAITEPVIKYLNCIISAETSGMILPEKPISMTEKALVAVLQSPYTKTVLSLIMKECSAAISEQEPLYLMAIPLS